MKIAYILYDDITLLDFIGIYDPISRLKSMGFLPELSWKLCAQSERIQDGFGLALKIDEVNSDLSSFDMIIVPGGFGSRSLMRDAKFLEWLQTAAQVPFKVSICTGSLLLGAAGFLKDKEATTHFSEYETLTPFCNTVIKDRIVEDTGVITAGAVAASLDLGLYLCEKLVGPEARETIRQRMNYKA